MMIRTIAIKTSSDFLNFFMIRIVEESKSKIEIE
jgi:hypothetical protein